MKKYLYIFVLMLLIILGQSHFIYAEDTKIQIYGETGVVIDSNTGDILYEKDAHKKMYPASTTKIMTALLVLENCELDEIITIDAETPFTEGSRIYLVEGERLTVEELLYSLLLESANDSAVALAKYVGGTTEEFVRMMNERAKELGAFDTNFVNPNGLPDENHTTTAYDLALIAKKAMENEGFRKIVSYSTTYTIPATEKQDARYFKTHNKLMWDTSQSLYYEGKYIAPKYEQAIGIKTGYTIVAGNCLVSAAKDNNREIISVILKSNATELYMDARRLLDYGLYSFKNVEIVKKGEPIDTVEVSNGKAETLDVNAKDTILRTIPLDFEEESIEKEIILNEKISAPVLKGDSVGKVVFKYEEKVLGETDLLAERNIEKKLISTMEDKVKKTPLGKVLGTLTVLIGLYVFFIIKGKIRRKRRRILRRNHYGLENYYINKKPKWIKKKRTKYRKR